MNKQLPAINTIKSLFSIILVWVYSWTFFTFFWKVPSWLFFLTLPEIGVNFAYAMSVAFVESLFWLLLFVGLAWVIPARFWADDLLSRAGWFFVGFYGFLTLFLIPALGLKEYFRAMSALGAAFVLGILLMLLAVRFKAMGQWLSFLADRLQVFIYLYIPISIISIIALLIRYLFLE